MLRLMCLLGFFCLCCKTCFVFSSDRERRISELERQMMEIGAYQKNQTFSAIYGPSKASGSSAEVFLDVLFFKTQQTASLFQTFIESSEGGATGALSTYIEPVSFDWSPGVRVGYRKENFLEDIALGLEYTYFSTQTNKEKKRGASSLFTGLTSLFQPHISAHADYKVLYQNLDVEILKSYFISQKILWFVFTGLKSSYLLQKETTHYELGFKTYQDLQFQSDQIERCRFTAIGPKIGFLSRWYVFKEFSLFNKSATALVYGYYLLKNNYTSKETSQDVSGLVSNKVKLKGGFHSLTPYGETTLGISWNRAFLKDKIQMTASLSYQALFFWRENKTLQGVGMLAQNSPFPTIKTINYSKKAEDIAFNGLVLEIELDF
jgi:hypothetical protein